VIEGSLKILGRSGNERRRINKRVRMMMMRSTHRALKAKRRAKVKKVTTREEERWKVCRD